MHLTQSPESETDLVQEEDFIAYMFGFQDSKGAPDIPKAVAELLVAEEQLRLSGTGQPAQDITTALIMRLRFRRTLLDVSLFVFVAFDFEMQEDQLMRSSLHDKSSE